MAKVECNNDKCDQKYHLSNRSMERAHARLGIQSTQINSAHTTVHDVKNDFQNDNYYDDYDGLEAEELFSAIPSEERENKEGEGSYAMLDTMNSYNQRLFGDVDQSNDASDRFSMVEDSIIDPDVPYSAAFICKDNHTGNLYKVSGISMWGDWYDDINYNAINEVEPYDHQVKVYDYAQTQNLDTVDSPYLKELFYEFREELDPVGDGSMDLYLIMHSLDKSLFDTQYVAAEDEPNHGDIQSPFSTRTRNPGTHDRFANGAYIITDKQTGESVGISCSYHSEEGTDYHVRYDEDKPFGIDGVSILERKEDSSITRYREV